MDESRRLKGDLVKKWQHLITVEKQSDSGEFVRYRGIASEIATRLNNLQGKVNNLQLLIKTAQTDARNHIQFELARREQIRKKEDQLIIEEEQKRNDIEMLQERQRSL